jgi:hypothetical protein
MAHCAAPPAPTADAAMAVKSRERSYYRVTFTSDRELYQVCARHVSPSDLYGLIELGGFIFPEQRLVYNPGEERLRREFEGIRRTWLPIHAIVRIDEIAESRETEVKIIPLEAPPRPQAQRLPDKPE